MGSLPMTRRDTSLKFVFWLLASHTHKNHSTVFSALLLRAGSLKLLMGVPTGWGVQIKLEHSGLKAYIYCRTSLKLKYASFHYKSVKGGHSETGWDLGPFAEVLAPEQTSPAI